MEHVVNSFISLIVNENRKWSKLSFKLTARVVTGNKIHLLLRNKMYSLSIKITRRDLNWNVEWFKRHQIKVIKLFTYDHWYSKFQKLCRHIRLSSQVLCLVAALSIKMAAVLRRCASRSSFVKSVLTERNSFSTIFALIKKGTGLYVEIITGLKAYVSWSSGKIM